MASQSYTPLSSLGSSISSFNSSEAQGCAENESFALCPNDLLAARNMYAGHGSAHPYAFSPFPPTSVGRQQSPADGDHDKYGHVHNANRTLKEDKLHIQVDNQKYELLLDEPTNQPKHDNKHDHDHGITTSDTNDTSPMWALVLVACAAYFVPLATSDVDELNLSSLAFEMELDDNTRDCSILSCRCDQCGRVVDDKVNKVAAASLQIALRRQSAEVSGPIKCEVCQERLLSCGHCGCML